MRWVSDKAIEQLRSVADQPDLSGTKYRLVHEIARGGMGAVYLCEDTELGREVAVKVLDASISMSANPSRMLREARIIARLEHPGIVPVHDLGSLPDGRIFYAMKLVRGSRLDEFVKETASLAHRLRVFQTVCETVAFAHSRGVIHRDLKPSNIMVGAFGEVLVIDWGAAKVLASCNGPAPDQPETLSVTGEELPFWSTVGDLRQQETAEGTVIGTPAYMAPEQARGEVDQLDERADIYALGAILYFLLAGHSPFPQMGRSSQSTDLKSLTTGPSTKPGVSKSIKAVCLKAMAEEPSNRYSGASELSADIGRFLAGDPVSAYRENLFEHLRRWVAKNRFIVFLVVAYLLMRMFLIFYSRR